METKTEKCKLFEIRNLTDWCQVNVRKFGKWRGAEGYPPLLFGNLTATSVSETFTTSTFNFQNEDLNFGVRKSKGTEGYPPHVVENLGKSRTFMKPLILHSNPKIERYNFVVRKWRPLEDTYRLTIKSTFIADLHRKP